MMTRFIAQLDTEESQRWLIVNSRVDALIANPTAYSARESEDIYLALNRFFMDVGAKYCGEVDEDYNIGRTGRIIKATD